jgi:hypothetical protein
MKRKALMLAWTHSLQSSRTVVHRHLRGRFARINSTPVKMMRLFLVDFREAREPDDVEISFVRAHIDVSRAVCCLDCTVGKSDGPSKIS